MTEEQAMTIKAAAGAVINFSRLLAAIAMIVGILGAALIWLTEPYVGPILAMPEQVQVYQHETTQQIEGLQKDVGQLRADIGLREPVFAEFRGRGIVLTPVVRSGGSVRVVYSLRQTVDCNFEVAARFFNLDSGTFIADGAQKAPTTRAPVSRQFTLVPLSIKVPGSLPPGRYSYYPTLTPLDCGVYGAISPTPTDPFTVEEDGP